MIDITQTALFLVIIVLAILLVVLGIQVFFLLRELKKVVYKANKVLDAVPISALSSLSAGVKAGISFANLFKKIYAKINSETHEKKIQEEHGK